MIPTEDNYIDWCLSGIKEYFRRLDFRVRTYSIGQVRERQCPVDRILAVGNKIVGLQFKRPTSETPPWRYRMTPHQHSAIALSSWIFYCLPDFAGFRFQEVALYHCKFASAQGTTNINDIKRYYRWGAFASELLGCHIGLEIGDTNAWERLVSYMMDNPHDAYVILDRRAEEVSLVHPGEASVNLEQEPA